MKPVFEEVLLLCPEAVTGGPEAMHQLAYAINTLGGEAEMAYYGTKSKVAFLEDRLQCTPNPDLRLTQVYAAYEPHIFYEAPLNPRSLVIFPETLVKKALALSGWTRAVWWLSVDNALVADPRLKEQDALDELFADTNLIHFYQSAYARDFLMCNGARQIYPLYDYVDRSFFGDACADKAAPAGAAKKQSIAYFPRKGGELAAQFVAAAPDLQFTPIENMSTNEVRQALGRSAIYLDFGNQPGKDRVPREAAASGVVVFLHRRGAAGFFSDHPLARAYLFSVDEIRSGDLHRRVRAALADLAAHRDKQRYYRQRVRMEKDEFELQVKTFFFEGG